MTKGVFQFDEPGQNLVVRSQESSNKLKKYLIALYKRKKNILYDNSSPRKNSIPIKTLIKNK